MTERANHYPRGTVEFVSATVSADVELDGQTVEISIERKGEGHDWQPAEWEGDPGTTRRARTAQPVTFDTDTLPYSTYDVYVRVTDSPEIPVIRAGRLTIGR